VSLDPGASRLMICIIRCFTVSSCRIFFLCILVFARLGETRFKLRAQPKQGS
jgi:hypothetical protein